MWRWTIPQIATYKARQFSAKGTCAGFSIACSLPETAFITFQLIYNYLYRPALFMLRSRHRAPHMSLGYYAFGDITYNARIESSVMALTSLTRQTR